jgi:hypothetical protein
MNKTELKKELHKLGIKTYRNKKTGAVVAKKSEIRTALARLDGKKK